MFNHHHKLGSFEKQSVPHSSGGQVSNHGVSGACSSGPTVRVSQHLLNTAKHWPSWLANQLSVADLTSSS